MGYVSEMMSHTRIIRAFSIGYNVFIFFFFLQKSYSFFHFAAGAVKSHRILMSFLVFSQRSRLYIYSYSKQNSDVSEQNRIDRVFDERVKSEISTLKLDNRRG